MDVTKPYDFIGFGAMDVTKPYEFTGFGAVDVTKPYKFIGFGVALGPPTASTALPEDTPSMRRQRPPTARLITHLPTTSATKLCDVALYL